MKATDHGTEGLEAYSPPGSSNIKGTASREAILAAARTLLGGKGLSDCSLAAVARAAGCSKASILYHFGTRDGLLHALIAEGTRYLLTTVEAAFSSYEPGDGGIEDAIRLAMTALFREESLQRLTAERELATLGRHDPAVAAAMADSIGSIVEAIAQFGHSIGMEPGLADLRVRAGCMVAATFGQIEIWLYSGGGDPLPHREAAIRSARAIALEGLRGSA